MKNVNLYDEVKLGEVGGMLAGCSTKTFLGADVGLHTYSVIDLVKAVAMGEVRPYKNNRGGGIINPKTVNEVANKFNRYCFGEIKLGKFDPPIIADGHGRMEGLIRRFAGGKLTEQEKDLHVSVQIVPKQKFYEVYELANSQVNHRAVEKLTNPDFLFGDLFAQLKPIVGGEVWEDFIKDKFYKQISYLFYYFAKHPQYPQNVSYVDVFACRDVTTELELCQLKKSPFKVSKIEFERLAAGIRFYVEVFQTIKDHITENMDTKPIKALRSSAPFMALIVIDEMSGTHQFGKSSLLLAKRILSNASDIRQTTAGLTHSSVGSTLQTEIAIRRILTPR